MRIPSVSRGRERHPCLYTHANARAPWTQPVAKYMLSPVWRFSRARGSCGWHAARAPVSCSALGNAVLLIQAQSLASGLTQERNMRLIKDEK